MKNYLLGFDARLCAEDYVSNLWNTPDRAKYLINSEIKWPLSVDRAIWPSIFSYGEKKNKILDQSQFLLHVNPVNERHKFLQLWPGCEEMMEYIASNNIIKAYVVMAILLISTENIFFDDYWHSVLDPIVIFNDRNLQWQHMGFDIADRYFHSGLSNCGYDVEEKALLKNRWSDRLNKHGLIQNEKDADEFRILTDHRVPEHAPFYSYSIYMTIDTKTK